MRQGKVRKYITSGINSRLNGSKEREGLADHGLYCSSGSVSFLSCSLSGHHPQVRKKSNAKQIPVATLTFFHSIVEAVKMQKAQDGGRKGRVRKDSVTS